MGKSIGLRRAALLAVGVSFAPGALFAAPRPAAAYETLQPLAPAAAAQIKFRAIRIDVSPLAENGLAPEAAWLAQDLPALLQAAFAKRLAPGAAGAPTLLVRVDLLILGESGGGGTAPFGGSSAQDSIEGAGVVLAPNGKPIAVYPMLATLLAYTGGSVYEVGTERRRTADLANSFAYWLPGQMGL
jgi:hypothetical protein